VFKKTDIVAVFVILFLFSNLSHSADTKLFGRFQAELNFEHRTPAPDPGLGIDDDAGMSRIGIHSIEKLSNSLTGVAHIEFRIDPSNGSINGSDNTTVFRTRNAFVGMRGKYGYFRVGSFHGPYKTHGGIRYDPFVATHLQARIAGGMSGGIGYGGHNGFIRNALYFTSNKVDNIQLSIAISPDDTNPAAGNGSGASMDSSLGLRYSKSQYEIIFAANINHQKTRHNQKMWKVGGKYNWGQHILSTQLEFLYYGNFCEGGGLGGCYTRLTPPGGGAAFHTGPGIGAGQGIIYFLGYQFKKGSYTLVSQFGYTWSANTNGRDTTYTAVGVIYKFLKKMRAFGGITRSDASGNYIDRNAVSLGIGMDF